MELGTRLPKLLEPARCLKLVGTRRALGTSKLGALRQETGLPLVKCRQALIDSGDDLERAQLWLKNYLLKANLNSSDVYTRKQNNFGLVALITSTNFWTTFKINCESDFVAMNSDFANLVEKMAAYVNRLQNSWNESSKDLQEHIQNSEHINSMLIENNLKFKEQIDLADLKVKNLPSFVDESDESEAQSKISYKSIFTYKQNLSAHAGVFVGSSIATVCMEQPASEECGEYVDVQRFSDDVAKHLVATSPPPTNDEELGEQSLIFSENDSKIKDYLRKLGSLKLTSFNILRSGSTAEEITFGS